MSFLEHMRFQWFEKADIAERAVWVSAYRELTLTIGQIVKQLSDKRAAHWEPPPPPSFTGGPIR